MLISQECCQLNSIFCCVRWESKKITGYTSCHTHICVCDNWSLDWLTHGHVCVTADQVTDWHVCIRSHSHGFMVVVTRMCKRATIQLRYNGCLLLLYRSCADCIKQKVSVVIVLYADLTQHSIMETRKVFTGRLHRRGCDLCRQDHGFDYWGHTRVMCTSECPSNVSHKNVCLALNCIWNCCV